jgi:HPt (histidine-containing phosphotransfer) domain-containing protein
MTIKIITSDLLVEEPDLIDLVDKFISRLPGMHDAIIKTHDAEDWETFSGLIHQMKGVGGGYGYPMLTRLCVDIEAAIKEKNFVKVQMQLNEFKFMSEQILAGDNENHKIAEANE